MSVRILRVLVALSILVMVAACGGTTVSASPSPVAVASPTPTPTLAPTPTPTPTPTLEATPTLEPSPTAGSSTTGGTDPTVGVTIAPPYQLTELDPTVAKTMSTAIEQGLGSLGKVFRIGVRQVMNGGLPAGAVMVIQIPGTSIGSIPGLLDGAVGGAAASSGVTITKTTVDGVPVQVGAGPSASFAAFLKGESLVFAYGAKPADALAIATALIKGG